MAASRTGCGRRIWGRLNSVNVQKVLWCCAELGLDYERVDAGKEFGRNDEEDYLAMNPNGRIPLLEEPGFVLWESNSIMRYLALEYGGGSSIYPAAPKVRASVDRWLDWTLSTLVPVFLPVFWGLVRTPPEKRDMPVLQEATTAAGAVFGVIDAQLVGRDFVEGEHFTLADIALGAFTRRWLGVEGVEKPHQPNLLEWYGRISKRPGFQQFIAPPMS